MKAVFAVLLISHLLLLSAMPVLADGDEQPVRVGYYLTDGCMNGREGETKSGYVYEYLQRIAGYTGWRYEYVYGDFAVLYNMLVEGKIDILPDISYTPEREELMLFPSEYEGIAEYYVVALAGNRDITSTDSIFGRRVGVLGGSYDEQVLTAYNEQQGANCTIVPYSGIDELFAALERGDIPALVAPYDSIASIGSKVSRQVGTIGDPVPFYFAVAKGRPDICQELGRTMATIKESDPDYFTDVYDRYISKDLFYAAQELTETEITWLSQHPHIQVGYLADHLPFSDTSGKTGEFTGVFRDILDSIADKYGLRYTPVEYTDYGNMMAALRDGSIDVAAPCNGCLWHAEQNDIAVSATFATTTLRALFDDTFDNSGIRRIAVYERYAFQCEYSAEHYPNAEIVVYDSAEKCLASVRRGETDACFYLETRYKHDSAFHPEWFSGLNDARVDDHSVQMCFATARGNANILALLDHEAAVLDKDFILNSSIIHSQHEAPATLRVFLRNNAFAAITVVAVVALLTASGFLLFVVASNRNRAKLEQAQAAAMRASHAKSEFLSSMSHDIRTPMNAITGMTEIALRRGSDAAQMRRCLEKIRLSSFHLLALVNDILDISKIESGKMSLNIGEFSLVELSEILIGLTREQAQEKKIDLRVHTHHFDQERLLGDALRIRQVYINLISNAIKYTPEGGAVDIDFRQEPVPEAPNKVRMVCTVKDTGIGMSREFQAVMYEPFARATDNRVNTIPGSGLGLPICRRMVELMDGTLECESELGKGTAFTVSILLERGRPDEAYRLPPMRLLAVDHDMASTNALSKIFERLGVTADIVNTPEELDELLRKDLPYQAAMVELHAPTQSGLAAVGMLRERYGAELPILLTDIGDMAAFSGQITALGITQTLGKPYFYRTVYQALCQLLGTAEYSGEHRQEPEEQSIAGMYVLAAEDNDMNWDILHELLELYGVTAERAENGRLCLEKLEAAVPGQYAAVLMDGRMPEMDGLEATRRIRSSEKAWLRAIPVVAMTADAFSEDIQNYLNAGADAHLAKPLDVQRLLAILAKIRKQERAKESARMQQM